MIEERGSHEKREKEEFGERVSSGYPDTSSTESINPDTLPASAIPRDNDDRSITPNMR